jgi:hypothetical protein
MYTTTRNIDGGTFMICSDCGEAISMNKICKTPLQSATNMLKHIAVHNASRAFAVVEIVREPEPIPAAVVSLLPASVLPEIVVSPETPNQDGQSVDLTENCSDQSKLCESSVTYAGS